MKTKEATKNETIVVNFKKERETPGTVVFKEVEEPGQPKKVGSLYLQKWLANGAEEVTATIEVKRAA